MATSGAANVLTYDPYKTPQSRHNRLVAQQNGWRWDPDYNTYRNQDGFAMNQDGEFPDNAVDCLR